MIPELLKAYHAIEECYDAVGNIAPHEIEMDAIDLEIDFVNELLEVGTNLLKKSDVEKYRNAWVRLKKQRQQYEDEEEEKNEQPYFKEWEH